jgi:hypothetical protein
MNGTHIFNMLELVKHHVGNVSIFSDWAILLKHTYTHAIQSIRRASAAPYNQAMLSSTKSGQGMRLYDTGTRARLVEPSTAEVILLILHT